MSSSGNELQTVGPAVEKARRPLIRKCSNHRTQISTIRDNCKGPTVSLNKMRPCSLKSCELIVSFHQSNGQNKSRSIFAPPCTIVRPAGVLTLSRSVIRSVLQRCALDIDLYTEWISTRQSASSRVIPVCRDGE